MPLSLNIADNLKHIEKTVDSLMSGFHKPEVIVGVEGGIGYTAPESIPGPTTDYLCRIAEKYGIYFVPGTMAEVHPDLEEGKTYNSAPVINPKGEIIAVYRKMAPWRPAETSVPGTEYVVFEIPEKETRIGVQICYDMWFPEISRNLTLMGAEVLLKLTQDPEECYALGKYIPYTRAIENQAYFVNTNAVGAFGAFTQYGHSCVIDPAGKLLWEGSNTETFCTVTLDLDLVTRSRETGTMFVDHYLQHLGQFNFPMPFAGAVQDAPLYQSIKPGGENVEQYLTAVKTLGIGAIGRQPEQNGSATSGIEAADRRKEALGNYRRLLDEFLGNKK